MEDSECSKPIKKPINFKISWPFHGNLRILKTLITEYHLVVNYLRLQSVVFSEKYFFVASTNFRIKT